MVEAMGVAAGLIGIALLVGAWSSADWFWDTDKISTIENLIGEMPIRVFCTLLGLAGLFGAYMILFGGNG